MISFCHGQEHTAQHHKHILVISDEIDRVHVLLSDFDVSDKLEYGKRVNIIAKDYEVTLWIIPPDFEQVSVLRRLIRSIDGIILVYSKSNYKAVETWLGKYNPKQPKIFTIIDDFSILEKMNEFHGKLSNSQNWKNAMFSNFSQ